MPDNIRRNEQNREGIHLYKQAYTIFFVKILHIQIFCSTFAVAKVWRDEETEFDSCAGGM